MGRVRISTTVDERTLRAARERLGTRDSELFDRALAALLDELDGAAERAALDLAPYDLDPDLVTATPGASADLTYDGEVPADVVELARLRRASR